MEVIRQGSRLSRLRRNRMKALSTDSELNEFLDHAEKWIGIRFPLEYLQGNRIMALYDRQGQMKGGYALIHRGNLRVVDSLPKEAADQLFEKFDRDSLFEMTALWLDRKDRSKTRSFYFWLKMYFEVVRLGKPNFIYAYSTAERRLGEIYQICQPVRIHEGPTKMLVGMAEPDEEVIEVGSIAACRRAWLKNPGFLFRRLVKKRSTKAPNVYEKKSA